MAESDGHTEPNPFAEGDGNTLRYTLDAGFLSGVHPPDSPSALEIDDGGSVVPSDSDSDGWDSADESGRFADLAASVHVFSDSLLRMELAEMEMIKARETLRLEAEKRRVESEAEMTRMLLQTQLQIAALMSGNNPNRKRKRGDEEESSTFKRKGAMLFSLMQWNLIA